MPVESSKFHALPLPVAALLRRARNAKSPRDRHDTAFHAWEVAIRLTVAARPPADASTLARPSLGHWVAAVTPLTGPLGDPAVLGLHGHLTEVVAGMRESPRSVEPRALLDALTAYRNKVIGHGAAARTPAFYDAGASLLADGLAALWASGALLAPDTVLLHVESVEEDENRRRRARLMQLRSAGPEILDPDGTPNVPESLAKGHVALRDRDRWTSLFPWVIFRSSSESILLFNSCARQAEYLDFASGDTVRGDAVEAVTPGAAAAVAALVRREGGGRTSRAHLPSPSRPAQQGDPYVGRTILGQYRVDRRIGAGSRCVYSATDVHLHRRVALKILDGDDASRTRAIREARVLSAAAHPNVVQILAAGVDGDVGCFAMEFVDGSSVQSLFVEHGPFDLEEAGDIILQTCRGLQAIHARGLVHRRVSPGCLVVAADGTLKITGFGSAHLIAEGEKAEAAAASQFAAPEDVAGGRPDPRADIFSVGVSLYFLLTKRLPYRGSLTARPDQEPTPIAEHRRDLPSELWPIVRRMLACDPAQRYPDMGAVLADLEPVVHAATALRGGASRRFGDFELLGKLGEGGMGVVYLARQTSLDRIVALKMLPPGVSEVSVASERFRREMVALSRCDHPNVVKILASGDEGGRLWYAMEYVEGADLAAVAGELASSAGLSEAVSSAAGKLRAACKEAFERVPQIAPVRSPIATDGRSKVADLAHAMRGAALGLDHLHAAGIVHRDVKPGNLMLTPERRVIVMDLGLAALRDASRSLTKDKGAVLGTLRYMAPEQLQRSILDVDARADVYSLGATFFELYTGRPLFIGDTEGTLIRQILYDEPPSPRKLAPSIPDDVATILSKCVAKDPRERYPSARAVAADLDAFLDGRPISARPPTFRYYATLAIRRNRTLFATAAVGLVIVAVVTTAFLLELRAERDRAREERDRAEALAGFMLGDLKTGLTRIGRTDLMRAVASQAQEYYAGVGYGGDDPARERGLARALADLAHVQKLQGDRKGAAESLEAAFEIRSRLLRDTPGDSVLERQLASVEFALGDLWKLAAGLDRAEQSYASALRRAERRTASEPDDIEWTRYTSIGHERLASVRLAQGRLGDATREQLLSLDISTRLAAAHPDLRELRHSALTGRVILGGIERQAGQVAAAERCYEEALAECDDLLRADPTNALLLRARGMAIDGRAVLMQGRGDLEAAAREFDRSVALRRSIVALDPSNAENLRDLAVTLDGAGDVKLLREDLAGAAAAHGEAMQVRQRLAALDPANTMWQRDLAISHDRLGGTLDRKLDADGAAREYRAAFDVRRKFAASDPNNMEFQAELAVSFERVGDIERVNGNLGAAATAYDESLAIQKKLTSIAPENVAWQRALALAHEHCGTIKALQRRLEEAAADYACAIAVRERLEAIDPRNAQWREEIAFSRGQASRIELLSGRRQAGGPDDLMDLATYASGGGDHETALATWTRALADEGVRRDLSKRAHYNAACAAALAAAAAKSGPERERHIATSLAWLREEFRLLDSASRPPASGDAAAKAAADTMRTDLGNLIRWARTSDPDLVVLRGRSEFDTVLREFEPRD